MAFWTAARPMEPVSGTLPPPERITTLGAGPGPERKAPADPEMSIEVDAMAAERRNTRVRSPARERSLVSRLSVYPDLLRASSRAEAPDPASMAEKASAAVTATDRGVRAGT